MGANEMHMLSFLHAVQQQNIKRQVNGLTVPDDCENEYST
jgi:hypothetical protein